MLSDVTVRAAMPNAADVAKCCCLSVVNCIESLHAWADDVAQMMAAMIDCFIFLFGIFYRLRKFVSHLAVLVADLL